jgi:hypothetical protein
LAGKYPQVAVRSFRYYDICEGRGLAAGVGQRYDVPIRDTTRAKISCFLRHQSVVDPSRQYKGFATVLLSSPAYHIGRFDSRLLWLPPADGNVKNSRRRILGRLMT